MYIRLNVKYIVILPETETRYSRTHRCDEFSFGNFQHEWLYNVINDKDTNKQNMFRDRLSNIELVVLSTRSQGHGGKFLQITYLVNTL